MPYITIKQTPAQHQITFEEIIAGAVKLPQVLASDDTSTRTYFSPSLNAKLEAQIDVNRMVRTLEQFISNNAELYKVDRKTLYNRFYIPKRHGGLRQINAPKPQLMNALRNLKTILEKDFFASHHTSAFAYVKGRCAVDSVKKHQSNESHWFLKIDFSDFFGSTTPGFLMHMLGMIYPFSEVVKSPRGSAALSIALDLCFLDGGLPQGTPISPMLTNLMMIPIDHRLYNCLRDYKGQRYVYTRYADDTLISSRRDFSPDEIITYIRGVLREFHAPFSIKDEKTRYGSRAGSNWNLGVMLNKDNQITIGNKNKTRFRAMISNYINDKKNGTNWDLHDVQVLRGLLEYYRTIEPEYISSVIDFNNKKYQVDVMAIMTADLAQ